MCLLFLTLNAIHVSCVITEHLTHLCLVDGCKYGSFSNDSVFDLFYMLFYVTLFWEQDDMVIVLTS